MRRYLMTAACALLVAGCKKDGQQFYAVKNTTPFSVTVYCADIEEPAQVDTTTIPSMQTLPVALLRYDGERVEDHLESGDTIRNLTVFKAFRDGTVPLREGLLQKDRWVYDERDPHLSYYTLTVTVNDL